MATVVILKADPLSRPEIYHQERGGLSGENLKRYLSAIHDGLDTLKMAPAATPSVNLFPMTRISRFQRGDYPAPIIPQTEEL
jgi:hypothetical protein